MEYVRRSLVFINQSYLYMFLLGGVSGASFELFKIKFAVGGTNFYSIFKRNQLKRELTNLENELRLNERRYRELLLENQQNPS